MRALKRALTVAGTAFALTVGIAFVSSSPSYASSSPPSYPSQAGQAKYLTCLDTTSGHGSYSSTYGGNVFVADSFGSIPSCHISYVEIIYRDKKGNERAKYASNTGAAFTHPNASLFLYPSQYSSVLQVIGSTSDWNGNNTGGVYLYF